MRQTNLLSAIALSVYMMLSGAALGATPAKADIESQQAEVRATETAFAKTMAERDFTAFGTFIADEAIFFGGDGEMRGKAAVVAAWKALYEGAKPPFSWAPESVVVLDSGGLALSSGPVLAPDGRPVGTFTSVWRLESPGVWKIVFDKGCDACPKCPAP